MALSNKAKFTLSGTAIAMSIALVSQFEGLKTTAYLDVVGIPTVCFGETRGVHLGDRYTVSECKDLLGKRLAEFSEEINTCLINPQKIPDKTYVAFLSTAYNIGSGAFCKSSIKRYANAGDFRKACESILLFNKARVKGVLTVVRGLTNRRQEEYKLCVSGLS